MAEAIHEPVTVLGAIRAADAQLTRAERAVARALLAHFPTLGLRSVHEFAAVAGVSAPSVIRFAQRLGFDGYPEFQNAILRDVEAQLASPLQLAARREREVPSAGDFLSDQARRLADAVEHSLSGIERAHFDALVTALSDRRKRLLLLGGRFSGPIAEYFGAHLQHLRPGVQVLSARDLHPPDRLVDIGRRDLVIAFDFRRYQEDVIAFCRAADNAGAQIALVTDVYLSPLFQVADHLLTVQVAGPSPFDTYVGAIALVEAITAATLDRIGRPALERMERMETVRSSDSPG